MVSNHLYVGPEPTRSTSSPPHIPSLSVIVNKPLIEWVGPMGKNDDDMSPQKTSSSASFDYKCLKTKEEVSTLACTSVCLLSAIFRFNLKVCGNLRAVKVWSGTGTKKKREKHRISTRWRQQTHKLGHWVWNSNSFYIVANIFVGCKQKQITDKKTFAWSETHHGNFKFATAYLHCQMSNRCLTLYLRKLMCLFGEVSSGELKKCRGEFSIMFKLTVYFFIVYLSFLQKVANAIESSRPQT